MKDEILKFKSIENLTFDVEVKTAFINLNRYSLMNLFAEVEGTSERVSRIYMNANTYSDIRYWEKHHIIDVETNKKIIQKGIFAYIWGAELIVDDNIPLYKILASSMPGKKIGLLSLNENTYPNAKELANHFKSIMDFKREMNDELNEFFKNISKSITKIEKPNGSK